MMRSLRARIAFALAIVVVVVFLVGRHLKVDPVPLSVMTILVMIGILVVSSLHAGMLQGARRQIEEYLATPDLGPPNPPPPDELVPFFDNMRALHDQVREQRAGLERETQALRAQAKAVSAAIFALQSQPALGPRYEVLLPLVRAESGMAAAGYYAWEQVGLPPSLVAWSDGGGPAPMPERALMFSPLETALGGGTLQWVEDPQSEETATGLRTYAADRGYKAAVFVPAVSDARTVGFLALFARDAVASDARLTAYLTALRAPMACAQEAAVRFERAVEGERVARTVNALLMAAGTSFSLDEAAARTLEHVYALEPYSRGAVLLVEDNEFLEVFAPTREGETGYFLGSRVRREGSCAARVMETRAVEIDAELSQSRTFQEDGLLIDEGYASRLVIPLAAAGRQIGCVYLVNRTAGAFSRQKAEDLRVPLEAVAVALEILRFNRELTGKVSSLDVGIAEKAMFLTGLNHEIRSQLRTLTELTEPLLDRRVSGLRLRSAESVQEVLARIRQLLGMLDGVVDIERMDAGARNLHMEEFLIAEAVKDVLWDLQSVLKSRNLEMVWELPQGLPPMVADGDRFRSLLFQLLSRAAQVTPPGGRIGLKANLLPASWVREKAADFMPPHVAQSMGPGVDVMLFSIVDQGEAVPAEIREQIFVEGSTPGLDSETTLKLYFVRRVVEMHRGAIWMEALPDGGNRIGLVLPQYSLDRVGFVNYVGKRLKEAREMLSCLSLISVGYRDRERLRQVLGEETFYRAMKELEGVVRHVVREPVDAVRRFQNGELIVIFAATDRPGAARMLDRLLQRVKGFQSSVVPTGAEIVTSVATYPDDALRAEEIIHHLEMGGGAPVPSSK